VSLKDHFGFFEKFFGEVVIGMLVVAEHQQMDYNLNCSIIVFWNTVMVGSFYVGWN
jgi:hypothetical protein